MTVPKPAHGAVLVVTTLPNPAQPGAWVQVTATGATAGITSCVLTASHPNLMTSKTCVIGAGGNVFGSFVVSNVVPGATYTVIVTTYTGAVQTDQGQDATFAVQAKIVLSPIVGVAGQTVTVTGYGFQAMDTTCTIASAPTLVASFVCSIGANGQLAAGSSFVVGAAAAPPSAETITVTGAPGADFATAGFTIVSVPTIVVSPAAVSPGFGTLPADGSGRVQVSGGGFSTGSTRACTLSSPTGPLFAASPATSCSISTVGTVTAAFAVSKTANPGLSPYTIRVTDTATVETANFAPFVLNAVPVIALGAATGVAGATVTVTSGAVFAPEDVGPCTISSSPSGLFVSSSPCAIDATGAVINPPSSFVVLATAPGISYSVSVTSNKGVTSAPQPFTVTAQLTLTPTIGYPPVAGTPGAPATTVTVTGTGLPANDNPCSFIAMAGLIFDTPTCTVNANGQLTATFKVGATSVYNAAGYAVLVKTLSNPAGVAVTPNFMVQPQIVLSPTSSSDGSVVAITGSGFSPNVGVCTLSPDPPVLAAGPQSCNQAATGTVVGSFTVGATVPPLLPGVYFVFVTDTVPGPTASAQLIVTGGPSIAFSPTIGTTGTTVTVTSPSGGWNSLDTVVTLTKTAGPNPPGDLWTMPNPTCQVSGGNIGACSFTVKSNAVGGLWTITITGNQGDKVNAQFMVQATLILSPVSAGAGVTVLMSGSGYMSAPGACVADVTSIPAGVLFSTGANPAACTLTADGLLTGNFIVDAVGPAPVGSYTVQFQNAAKVPQTTVTAGFTVTLPQVTFSANSGSGGDTISVSGSGFASTDTTCTITGGVLIVTNPICTISGGVVTGSFVVGTAGTPAQAGVPLTVTGNLLDSATNTFSVVPKITLTPNPAAVGSTVTVTGKNFATPGVCAPGITGPAVAAPVCNVAADFTLSGSYTVLVTFAGSSAVTTADDGTASATATQNIVPRVVTLSPPSGPVGASILVSGTGFSPTDLTCVIAGAAVGGGATCSISGGIVTGSFPVIAAIVPGVSTVTVTGAPGTDFGTAEFTVEPGIQLLPTSGRPGTNVLISGTNFAAADTGCTLSSTPSGLISSPLCTVAGGAMSGSFTVAAGTSGAYTVNVAGTTGDIGHATFNVPPPPTLTLTPDPANAGSVVTASGNNYAGTTCLLTSAPSGLFSVSPSCSIVAGTLSGSFTVASVASGSYTVTASTNAGLGDSATDTLTVSPGPVPTLTLLPTSGGAGAVVTGTGTGFTADTTCILSAAPSTVLSSSSCTILSGGDFTVGFTVSSGATVGTYTILAVGNTGKAASALFDVTPSGGRTLELSPTSGRAGTVVTVSGLNYVGTTCTLSSSPTNIITSQTCTISAGDLTGGFTVASGATGGAYTVTVTTDIPADTVTASFTVPSPTLTLSPTSGASGTTVTASGSNYAGTTCTLAPTPSALFTSHACSISGTGVLSGSFTVDSGARARSYTVTVTTSVSGETASASFTVPAPTLALTPNSAAAGTAVGISGTNYAGTTCTLASSPSGLISSPTCSISGGILDGGFVVASGATIGSYTVTVTTNISGETASATFTIPSPSGTKTLTLSPNSGRPGATVTVSGANYVGTSCTLSSSPSGLLSSPTCSIASGTLTGGFTVASAAVAGGYTVTVTTNISGETVSTTFTVPSLKPCIIATATFGSEASPAVQYLRNFRDTLVLSTRAGSAFMDAFNAWYYSFSPSVASFIAGNDPLRAPVRVILYPLLGILGVSTLAYSMFSWAPELGVVVAGLVASSLIGLVYFTAPALIGMRALLRRRRLNAKTLAKASLASLAVALALLTLGEVAGSFLLLAIAGSAVVLICVAAAPTIAALIITRQRLQ